MDSDEVLKFWFEELVPKDWFSRDSSLDDRIRKKFLAAHAAARQGELDSWRENGLGRLAEVIVLDQFSRNLFREDPRAFASDGIALVLAQESIRYRLDRDLTPSQKSFLYMPFMHSESPAIHERALQLFSQAGLESNLEFEWRHKKIIDRFGRFPHRNAVLGRTSTPEELEFLKQSDSSF